MFDKMRAANEQEWADYTTHSFVRQMAEGTLPEACFQHYLKQDYIFLIHFARAYGLAVFKSQTLADMKAAKEGLSAILDQELSLHITYCQDWGLTEADLENLPEATATMAYTRYVLERGLAGSLVDLHVALAPCIVGYAEVAQWMLDLPSRKVDGNPYQSWIVMYSSDEYKEVANAAKDWLNTAGQDMSEAEIALHAKTFGEATRLESAFWQMGLDLSV